MCGPAGTVFDVPVELKLPHFATSDLLTEDSNGANEANGGAPNFILKTGSGSTWRNIELLKAPFKASPNDSFVTVLINHL